MAPTEKGFSWSNIAVGAVMNLVRLDAWRVSCIV